MEMENYGTTQTAETAEPVLPDGSPLEVTEVMPGLHEKAEGIKTRPVYRLCWPRPGRRAIGRIRLSGGTCSGNYVKLSPERIALDEEAARRYRDAAATPATEETAVFLRTELGGSRLELVLASRTSEAWSALHHWTDSWRGLGISRVDVVS